MTQTVPAPLSYNAICYEAVQRVFRNSMVDYVRVRLFEIFGDEHLAKLRLPFKSGWEELKAKASLSRQIGGTETQLADEYDLLDVGHFFNIFDVYFDKLFSVEALEGTDYVRPVKTKFLGNLKQIKDSRDPNSHPVSQEVPYEEALAILTDCRQVLQWLGLRDAAGRILSLLHSLPRPASAFEEEPLLVHETVLNLPTEDSIYYDFIGRQEVLAELKKWFEQKQKKRCLLAGDGGKGKSAVAYRFALELMKRENPDLRLITWVSAKQKRFQDGRTVPTEAADFSDLETAVDKLLSHYGTPLPEIPEPLETKKDRLLKLLNDYPAFIVVDDIDTVLSDDEVVGFFYSKCRRQSRLFYLRLVGRYRGSRASQ